MCWKCKKQSRLKDPVEFRAVCAECGEPFHVCKNCRFYSPGAHYDCAETVEEPVFDKEKANFCEFFRAKSDFSDELLSFEAEKSAFNALFKE